ncbi:hypothetical protein PanWU01x14_035000 [Parasponia andersonii]|uniref:Uncharacterized protein n=1 Tax=Parasponia andersonii TaxID=3476 RepID=A0A2P5DT34_PARAD|nr:hypothetical protein PanWU01x14_035000 [Parasponia andersonii]
MIRNREISEDKGFHLLGDGHGGDSSAGSSFLHILFRKWLILKLGWGMISTAVVVICTNGLYLELKYGVVFELILFDIMLTNKKLLYNFEENERKYSKSLIGAPLFLFWVFVL